MALICTKFPRPFCDYILAPGVDYANSFELLHIAAYFTHALDQEISAPNDCVIGSGGFGVVWGVRDPRTGQRVALKKIVNAFTSYSIARRTYRELRMLTYFRHENLLAALDVIAAPHLNEVYLISELMETDLNRIIGSRQAITIDHVKCFIYQILRGLKYLHSSAVLHRDIKPGNLLVNSNCLLKIADFGLARVESCGESVLTHEVVTQWYRPPELLMGAERYTTAVDMWSVGCVMAELLARRVAFRAGAPIQQLAMIFELLGTPDDHELKTVSDGARSYVKRLGKIQPNQKALKEMIKGLHPHIDSSTENSLHSLLTLLWKICPSKRVSAAQAIEHPLLSDGRRRFHTCMCTCCYDDPITRLKVTHIPLEPICPRPLPADFDQFRSTRRLRDAICSLASCVNSQHRFPLQINTSAPLYPDFVQSTVVQPSNPLHSPHKW